MQALFEGRLWAKYAVGQIHKNKILDWTDTENIKTWIRIMAKKTQLGNPLSSLLSLHER